MAKIRVYELARKLNMKNKELLDKLEEMNIEVRSHMSSLEDDTVSEIKLNLQVKKKPDTVEVTRVKPTVIRRRKKTEIAKPVEEEEAKLPAETDLEPVGAEEEVFPEMPLGEEVSPISEASALTSDEETKEAAATQEAEISEEAVQLQKDEEIQLDF